jgi:ribonuclease E
VRNIQSHGLSITRLIEEEALKEKTAEIQVQLPPEMATFIMNEKRDFIKNIEKRHGVSVIIIANPYLHSPQYSITRLKEDNVGKAKKPSYSLIQQPELHVTTSDKDAASQDEPAVKSFAEHQVVKHPHNSFIKRLWTSLFGGSASSSSSNTHEHVKKSAQAVHNSKHNKGPNDRRPSNSRRRRPNQQRSGQQSGGNNAMNANPNSNQQQGNQQHGNQQQGSQQHGNQQQGNQQRRKPNPNQGQQHRSMKNESKKREPALAKEQPEK